MSKLTFWSIAILVDTLMLALLYVGIAGGKEAAMSVAVFWGWALAIFGILTGLIADKTMFKNVRPSGFIPYYVVTEVVIMSAFVVAGHVWLAAMRLCSDVLCEGARKRDPKGGAA